MPATQEINQVGKREDLSDALVLTNAGDTPFTTMIRKGSKPGNTLMEYPIDKYDDTDTSGIVDGADVETYEDAQENRALLYSRVQKWRRAPRVTDMGQNVSVQAGTASPIAEAKAKKTVELKYDMEATFFSDNESQADTGSVPYKTRGLGKWLQATAQTDLPVATAFLTPSGQIYSSAIGSLDEDTFRGLLQTRFETLRMNKTLYGFVATNVKNTITDFSRYEPDVSGSLQVRRFTQSKPGEIQTSVDVYKGDYGRVILMLSSFMPNTYRGYLLDMEMLELRMSRNPGVKDLPDLGGGPRAIVDCIGALLNKNPQAHIKIAATA